MYIRYVKSAISKGLKLPNRLVKQVPCYNLTASYYIILVILYYVKNRLDI